MKKKYDIIIPGWNMSEMTVKCLKSIKTYTRNFRVIYVDNGSETKELEKIMEVLEDMPHLLIANKENLGFIKATNAGIRASEAPYVILMNNDTEAVKGWIAKMKKPLEEKEKVAMSGPLTTTPESWQGKWPKGKPGYVVRETGMLAFFCVMIKRDLFREVGLLSESFGVGFGDDDEFCSRALSAGFKLALVQNLVIPHHHRTTFKKIYTDQQIKKMQDINMQKYKDVKYNIGFTGNVDVVYVLGKGSRWADNEIRYSIRSFKQHFKDLRNVVIVGELPFFLRGLMHIPYPDKAGLNKDGKMMLKIMAACKSEQVSKNFVLCTDDTVLLKDLNFEDFKGWHYGPIIHNKKDDHTAEVVNPKKKPASNWFDFVYNTGNELKSRNLPHNNYDRAHAPQPVNKQEFIEVLEKWDMVNNHYTVSNIYNNSSKLFTGEDIRGRNLKVSGPATTARLDELTAGKVCMNFSDPGLNEHMKEWLARRFPKPSEYEIFTTVAPRREAVEEWFKNGCNYDEGMAIFKQFAPKNRQLLNFFEKKKETRLGEIKMKKTLRLWMR